MNEETLKLFVRRADKTWLEDKYNAFKDKKIYHLGDTVEITKDMVNALSQVDGEKNDRLFVRDFTAWLGKKGTVCAKRLDRSFGQTCIDWGENQITNTLWLEDIGLEFKHSDFSELPIMECPEEFLTERELIIKTLMSWGQTEAEATAKVDEIVGAMAKHGIVFYRP